MFIKQVACFVKTFQLLVCRCIIDKCFFECIKLLYPPRGNLLLNAHVAKLLFSALFLPYLKRIGLELLCDSGNLDPTGAVQGERLRK